MVSLFIAACSAKTIQEAPTPTILVPTETLPTPLPTATQPVIEKAADEPDLISVHFIDSEQVIPADMDIALQEQEVVSQFSQITSDGSNLWAAGSIQDINFFTLKINTLNQDLPEAISISFPLQLDITESADPYADVNIISLIGSGGGAESRYFPTPPLQTGAFELTPDEPSPVNLTDEADQIAFDFAMSCQQSGAFDLNFKIPYTVEGNEKTKEHSFEYGIQIVCPETATLWYLMDKDNGQIEDGGRWIFQDTHYVPLR